MKYLKKGLTGTLLLAGAIALAQTPASAVCPSEAFTRVWLGEKMLYYDIDEVQQGLFAYDKENPTQYDQFELARQGKAVRYDAVVTVIAQPIPEGSGWPSTAKAYTYWEIVKPGLMKGQFEIKLTEQGKACEVAVLDGQKVLLNATFTPK